jgi:hypothetical protein
MRSRVESMSTVCSPLGAVSPTNAIDCLWTTICIIFFTTSCTNMQDTRAYASSSSQHLTVCIKYMHNIFHYLFYNYLAVPKHHPKSCIPNGNREYVQQHSMKGGAGVLTSALERGRQGMRSDGEEVDGGGGFPAGTGVEPELAGAVGRGRSARPGRRR